MAEMTASEAIAVLHNNQYRKHIANGEYDYIHPLTDAECKGIESLIQQQQQTIEAMKPVVTAAEEFCQTVVYVQSQYAEDGSAYVRTSMDAVSKLHYFVRNGNSK